MSVPAQILLVEDEAPIRKFVRASLEGEGYRLTEAETGQKALALAASQPPDLVILDLGLPDKDGLDVLRSLREWLAAPVIVLSARGQEKDKIAALDSGADDYLTKPFGMGELLARIRVALRHARRAGEASKAEPRFTVGELAVDLAARRVFVQAQEVRLTPSNTACSACSCSTRARSSRIGNCSRKSGGRATPKKSTTCGCSWPACGGNSKPTPRSRAICSPSKASAIGWRMSKRSRRAAFARRLVSRDLRPVVRQLQFQALHATN